MEKGEAACRSFESGRSLFSAYKGTAFLLFLPRKLVTGQGGKLRDIHVIMLLPASTWHTNPRSDYLGTSVDLSVHMYH